MKHILKSNSSKYKYHLQWPKFFNHTKRIFERPTYIYYSNRVIIVGRLEQKLLSIIQKSFLNRSALEIEANSKRLFYQHWLHCILFVKHEKHFCVYLLNIGSSNYNCYEKQNKRNVLSTYECKGREEDRGAVVKGWSVKSILSIGYGVNGIQIKSKRVDFRACGVSAGVGVHRRRGRRLTCACAPDTSTPSTDRPCGYVTPTSEYRRKLYKNLTLCTANPLTCAKTFKILLYYIIALFDIFIWFS